jgi:hypothetical protein
MNRKKWGREGYEYIKGEVQINEERECKERKTNIGGDGNLEQSENRLQEKER